MRIPKCVSVVVPVLNGADLLRHQLDALARQTYAGDWELVVADNGSIDDIARVLLGFSGNVSLKNVDASARRGSSFARNEGVSLARGDLIAFCDADDVVTDTWLAGLAEAAQSFDLVGGEQLVSDINDPLVQSWRSPRSIGQLASHPGFWPYVPSCNMAVWKSVFLNVGGFADEYVQAHDVDFCWRVLKAGYSIGFAPEAGVHYRYRTDLAGVRRQAYRSGFEAAKLFSDYRIHGMPRASEIAALRRVGWLIARAPKAARDLEMRGTWFRRLGETAGRLVGSLRYGVRYL